MSSMQDGNYKIAVVSYELMRDQAVLLKDSDMYIEATLRQAGVVLKQGELELGFNLVEEARRVKAVTDSGFDIDQFLTEEIKMFT